MIPTPAQRVAAEVRAEMARQRRTQAELAIVLELSQQSVSRRMSGAQPFDVNELGAVASWLGVDLCRLLNAPAVGAA